MAGILSKGITLSYKENGEFQTLTNLQEIPEIGNTAPEKIDVTVLSDEAKKYMAGLKDSGQELSFKFLHDSTQFAKLSSLTASCDWKIELPDGITATFPGTPSVKLGSAGVNAALTYTLTIIVEDVISFN